MQAVVAPPRDDQGKRFAPADWVLAARKSRGLGQEALARRLDVSPQTISKRERGAQKTPWENWVGILHALGLPISWEPGDPVPASDAGDQEPT